MRFVVAAFCCGLAYLVAVAEFPKMWNIRRQALLFWAAAVVLRVALLPLEPGDDLWRYQWEGRIQHPGINPYTSTPDDPEVEPLRADYPNWARISHREVGTVYPPAAELMFAGLSAVSDRPLLYKLVFAAADLGLVAVLVTLIGGPSRYRRAAWYAWNPLAVYSFAGGAHFDSVMILPMLVGVLLLVRFERAADNRSKWLLALAAAAAFGLGISVKLIPLLLLPVCIFPLGVRAVSLALSAAIPAMLSLCYGYPRIDIWHSLGAFANVTRVNDLFWWLIEETVWPNPRQKNYHYNVVLIATIILLSLLFRRNWKRGILWVLGAALILSPALHPWYCTWVLPLATWRRVYAWHVLSITVFAYFLFWNERLFALPWHAEPWQRAIIIVPPLVALGIASWRAKQTPPGAASL